MLFLNLIQYFIKLSLKMTTRNKKLYNISVPQFKQKFLNDKTFSDSNK